MKRRALKLLVFLLAGAIINVAVAWGFAVARESMTMERNQQGYFAIWGRPWQVVQQQRFGMIDVWWADGNDENLKSLSAEEVVKNLIKSWKQRWPSQPRMQSGRPREQLAHAPRWGTFGGEPLPQDITMGGDIAFGFPAVCLWMQTTCDMINLTTSNDQLHGGWLMRGTLFARGNEFIALPNRILFPGFAINTIFYAAVLWVLFAVPVKLRKWRRIKRGQCASCGYSLRGHDASGGGGEKCPECGTLSTATDQPIGA
jgi:hypothetical protein